MVGNSPHREEYERMMRAGWSSLALERYAAFRYGEDIPGSTFRLYRQKKKIEVPKDQLQDVQVDDLPDVLQERARMIRLQKERIALDVGHERAMGKLFGSTRGEIRELSILLSEQKQDLQDLGLLPKAGEKIELSGPQLEDPKNIPAVMSLSEIFGGDPSNDPELAKVLHMRLPKAAGEES